MDTLRIYPKRCREGIRTLGNEIGVCAETAFAMMLMTAALMDLDAGDAEVVRMILKDCGIADGDVA